MKIVHFTNNLTDGAGKAVYRIHKGLIESGIDSIVLVAKKDFIDKSVKQIVPGYSNIDNPIINNIDLIKRGLNFFSFILKEIKWKLLHRKWSPLTLFNFNKSYFKINNIEKHVKDVDIICLYSIQSFMSPKLIKQIYKLTKAPIVWTPMDIEPFTGGCHFNNDCKKFYENCGFCPSLNSKSENDISRKIFDEKKKYLYDLPITFVAVSKWVEEWIKKSSLFNKNKTEIIFLGIDDNIFKKTAKQYAREILNLPSDKKLILFGCLNLDDKRKGGHLLLKSLTELGNNVDDKNKIVLVTIGRKNNFRFEEQPFMNIHLGLINDDRVLSLLYNSVDIITIPSIDDPGPLMANEALMCKTTIVTFNSGIATEIINDESLGYRSENYNIESYAKGILKYLNNNYDVNDNLSIYSKLTLKNQVQSYKKLFKNLMNKEIV